MSKEKKKSFILYHDFADVFNLLSIQDRGILITAIFEYAKHGDIITEMPYGVTIAFQFIKNVLDRDKAAYIARCEANSVNGKKGGRPKKPLVFEKAKKPDNDSDNDSDNENEIDIDIDSDSDSDSDSGIDSKYASACSVSDAHAPQLCEDDKKYLEEKGIPRQYIEERAERAEAYAKDSGEDAIEVIRKWWQKDRDAPQYGASGRYAGKKHRPRAQEMEDWFEERLRDAFGDEAV